MVPLTTVKAAVRAHRCCPCRSTASCHSQRWWHCCLPFSLCCQSWQCSTSLCQSLRGGPLEPEADMAMSTWVFFRLTLPTPLPSHFHALPLPSPRNGLVLGRIPFLPSIHTQSPWLQMLLATLSHHSKRLYVRVLPESFICWQDSALCPGLWLGRRIIFTGRYPCPKSTHPFDPRIIQQASRARTFLGRNAFLEDSLICYSDALPADLPTVLPPSVGKPTDTLLNFRALFIWQATFPGILCFRFFIDL